MLFRHFVRWISVVALTGSVFIGVSPLGPVVANASPSWSAGAHQLTLLVQGRNRQVDVEVPSGPGPWPLVLVFHGANATASSTASSTDFVKASRSMGYVVAFLQGYKDSWSDGINDTPASAARVDDLLFSTLAIVSIEQRVSVKKSAVAAVGFSNGSLMVHDLACRNVAGVTIIIPVEGEIATALTRVCHPTRPVSVLEIHGTRDASIPYNGGYFTSAFGGGTTVLSAPMSVAFWARREGCASTPVTKKVAANVKTTTYLKCHSAVSVTLRTLEGGGHSWPSDVGIVVGEALHLHLPSGARFLMAVK